MLLILSGRNAGIILLMLSGRSSSVSSGYVLWFLYAADCCELATFLLVLMMVSLARDAFFHRNQRGKEDRTFTPCLLLARNSLTSFIESLFASLCKTQSSQ